MGITVKIVIRTKKNGGQRRYPVLPQEQHHHSQLNVPQAWAELLDGCMLTTTEEHDISKDH